MICVSGRARNDFSRLSDDDGVEARFPARAEIVLFDSRAVRVRQPNAD